ncbi:hypothetical protein MON38_19300 [Hymenobacter sp. DH14]|uniref:Uncharacterized protein n=1 Tax=Hymenobacter cyanobacteriorum TaxID=2926463 RepID=A0A9X1VM66_9BACT|nr:hypothetical protein [Hymenobacter cyanobacteriorum]MCI1189575.1 hypothetical protein [Hymenobacter cyanobacteriorum]
MKNVPLFALLLALPFSAAHAQTKTTTTAKTSTATTTAKPGTEQVTEVTEDLDPATGKVIRRTTRTTTVPAGTAAGTTARPGTTVINPSTGTSTPSTTATVASGVATDTAVSDFFRERMTVSRLTAPQLLDTYTRFLDKVREDRREWTPNDWTRAANVLSALNGRYEQLRSTYTLDDKLTIRGVQGEFQALRTAKQISGSVSDKL